MTNPLTCPLCGARVHDMDKADRDPTPMETAVLTNTEKGAPRLILGWELQPCGCFIAAYLWELNFDMPDGDDDIDLADINAWWTPTGTP